MTIDELVRKYNLRDDHRFMIERLLETGNTLEDLDKGIGEAVADESEPEAIFLADGAAARPHPKQGEAKR